MPLLPRLTRLRFASAFVLLSAAGAHGQDAAPGAAPPSAAAGAPDAPQEAPAVAPLPVEEVAPGAFVHEGEVALMSRDNLGAIANVGFVVGEEAVAVVDPGGSVAQGEALLAAIRAETDLPVRYVVFTHVHPDHVFGAGAFLSRSGVAELVGHAKLPRALAARADHYVTTARAALGEARAGEVEIVLPERLVERTETLDLGGRRLVLRAWPTAHTDNDLTVLDEATGTLFAGDLVFLDHLPVVDGSLVGWLRAHEALAEIEAERVVPGHGPASAPWPEALEPQRRYLEALADHTRRRIAEGAGMAEAVATAPPPEEGWSLVEAFHRRNATAAFAELEWE